MQERKKENRQSRLHLLSNGEMARRLVSCSPDARFEVKSSRICECSGRQIPAPADSQWKTHPLRREDLNLQTFLTMD